MDEYLQFLKRQWQYSRSDEDLAKLQNAFLRSGLCICGNVPTGQCVKCQQVVDGGCSWQCPVGEGCGAYYCQQCAIYCAQYLKNEQYETCFKNLCDEPEHETTWDHHIYFCEHCDHINCLDCLVVCAGCDRFICMDCIGICSTCGTEHVPEGGATCKDCLIKCCGEYFCRDGIEQHRNDDH